MNDQKLDDYLAAYAAQTDGLPSAQLMDRILAVSQQPVSVDEGGLFKLWHLFDLMIPKAIGWALTGCLGLYIGLSSADQSTNIDDEFYLYDQTQLILSEGFITEDIE